MKIAFLIATHNQPKYLEILISMLQHEQTSIYVHINPQSINKFEHLTTTYKKSSIHFYSQYIASWGGNGLIHIENLLLSEAMKDENNSRFIFLSGSDIICKPIQTIIDYFNDKKNRDYQFINYFKLPYTKSWGKDGGLHRIEHYHLFDIVNCGRKWTRRFDKLLNILQTAIGVHRRKFFRNYYGGEGWWIINRIGASVLLNSFNNENIMKAFKHTFASDEILPHTILANNKSLKLCNKTFRYQDWSVQPSPGILTEKHLDKIRHKDIFFARKIDLEKSKVIISYCLEIQQNYKPKSNKQYK